MSFILSISFHNEKIAEQSYKQLYDTIVDKSNVFILDNNYPLLKDKDFIKNICKKYGFTYFNAGHNLGLHEGYNYLITQLPKECDTFICYDGDSYPVTQGWDVPIIEVFNDEKVVWSSLHNVHSFNEMDERGYTDKIINNINCRVTKKPVVNSICAFKRKWLEDVGFLSEPSKYYGGLEMAMWYKKKPEYDWVFLKDFTEIAIPNLSEIQDSIYTEYKWEHAHKGNNMIFAEYVKHKQLKGTADSLKNVERICKEINNLTFHFHYHILSDIASLYNKEQVLNYLEIGCYGGGSASLMLQRPFTNVVSIDLGGPITQEVAEANVSKLNVHGNLFTYVKGNSQNNETKNKVKSLIPIVDILFIDGDHSYNGVLNDFNLYNDLVRPGGYIVFDDYLDAKYSPEVRKAVDKIISTLKGYSIVGTLKNEVDAYSLLEDNSFNNCFIIRKYQ